MKRILLLQLFLFTAFGFAQVGVNTTTPDPSSMLDVSSTNKGALFPRVSLSNINLTTLDGTNTAATGLLIWNTNAATIGGNGVGYYFFNGTIWVPVLQAATSDHDWYEVGGTNPPNAITDSKFTQGSLSIGSNLAATGVVDIETSTRTTNLDITNTNASSPVGINININSTSGTKTGINLSNTGTNAGAGGLSSMIYSSDTTVGNHSRYAMYNFMAGAAPSAFTQNTGIYNIFSGGAFPGTITGIHNQDITTSNGARYGVYNTLSGTGNGDHHGLYNYLSGTGTGNKYGILSSIDSASGGTHYGIYSNATSPTGYAGYFLGRMSIGTTGINNYILPSSRGTANQIMQTDGIGNVSWVTPASTTDLDWFELNTTNPANAITDNIYTQGKVSVGSSTLSNGKFNVYNSAEPYSIYAENTFSPAANTYTAYLTNSGTGANQRYGLFTDVSGGGSGMRYGIYNTNTSRSTGNQGGVFNFLTGSGGDFIYGLRNYISATGSGAQQQFGVYNDLSTVSDSQIMGVYNFNTSSGNGMHYGTHNRILGNGNGSKYGTYNFIIGTGTGMRYGNYNYISGNGTNNKYGTYNLIDPLAAGTHYGLYSEALKTGSYAGYFLGNLSIGTSTVNNYILPPSRGTNGQLMQTDGVGNVSWVNASTIDTDDQNLLTPTLVGTTLNLNIENGTGTSINLASLQDGTGTDDQNIQNLALNATTNVLTIGIENGTSQTVNLTPLKEWTDVGASIHPSDGITEEVTIGTLAAGTGKLTIDANEMASGIDIEKSGNFAVPHFAIDNYVSNQGGGGSYGIRNILEGTTGSNMRYAVYNEINGVSSPSNVSHYGVYNNITSTGTGTRYGSYNSVSGVGTGDKFGTYNSIPTTSTGDHYGIYSEALRTTGNVWAGYFLGNVAIGTTTANTYNFPASRGTNGQIMQTDATGVVSWVNAPTAESTTANNGLTETVNNVQLGGALVQNTAITQGTFSMDINLNNTGDFSIQDNGTDVLFVEDTGEIGIGTNTPLYPLHMVENGVVDNAFFLDKTETSANNTSGIFINKTGQGTGRSHAIFTDVDGTGTGQKYGVFNQISSTAAGNQYGTRNFISGSSPSSQFGTFNNLDNAGTGIHYGNYNGMRGTSAATLYANYNEFDNVTTAANSYGNYTSFSANATGTGDKYATYNIINTAIPGTHYGTFNSVGVANGWAGYFLGRNYISDREAIGETDNPNAGLSINKNSTGTYSHIELKEATANDGARLTFSNTAEVTNNWLLYGRADNTITDSRFNIFHTTTGNIMQITGDGLVGILRTPTTNQLEINGTASKAAAGAFIANSDSRLKKNIATISPTEALEKVLSLRGVTYEWNDNKTGMNRPEGTQLGFVAQEIQLVFPEKVTEDKQGYLQTAYGDYDPIIFQAIKALSDKIDKLEKENEELKKRIEDKK